MDKYYYTLYGMSYGTAKAKLKNKMSHEDAERLGIEYCDEYDLVYYGTFSEDEIDDAHDELRSKLYNNV